MHFETLVVVDERMIRTKMGERWRNRRNVFDSPWRESSNNGKRIVTVLLNCGEMNPRFSLFYRQMRRDR